MTVRRLVVLGALLAAWLGGAAQASESQTLVYDILRNGSPLGTQRFTLHRADDVTWADLRTEIDYKFLDITLYSFRQNGREVWRDGRLVELVTETNDNGKPQRLQVRRDGGGWIIDGARSSLAADGELAAASLWNRDALSYQALIDTIDGSILPVSVVDAGEEAVDLHGRIEPARRYQIAGSLRREVWYHPDGRLLRVRFTGSDGSVLEYRLAQTALK